MKSAPTEPWIPILFTVLLLLGLGIAVGIAGQVKLAASSLNNPAPVTPAQSPSSSPGRNGGGVKFGGTLTADGCVTSQLPVGDVGCSVTVDKKYIVEVEHGNAKPGQPWGTMIGFPAYPKSPVGSVVTVYAHQVNQTNFTLEGSSSYYVKIQAN
jgi:hypothetical protein